MIGEFSLCSFGACSEDDGIVSTHASGNVNLINTGMLTQVTPNIASAIDYLQITILNQGGKGLF